MSDFTEVENTSNTFSSLMTNFHFVEVGKMGILKGSLAKCNKTWETFFAHAEGLVFAAILQL